MVLHWDSKLRPSILLRDDYRKIQQKSVCLSGGTREIESAGHWAVCCAMYENPKEKFIEGLANSDDLANTLLSLSNPREIGRV